MTANKRIALNIVATYGRSLYALVIGLFCGRWTLGFGVNNTELAKRVKIRVPYIDAAKGIGILLVVLGHIVPVDNHVKGFLYSFHMPLFFILAGMVLPCVEKIENTSFLPFFLKRCKSLLFPYFLVGGGIV